MSESASHSDEYNQRTNRPALGDRSNWWVEEVGLPQPDDTKPRHAEHSGTSRAEWITHKLVKESAPAVLSGAALFGDPDDPLATHDDNVEVELTEPQCYVASSTFDKDGEPERELCADPSRRRVDEEHGYLSRAVADLVKKGLVYRGRDGWRKRVVPSDARAVYLYRDLVRQHSHIEFSELLTGKALEVLY